MNYVGLDVHKAFSSMEALNPATGEVWECKRLPTDLAGLTQALAQVPAPKTVVLEAGRNSLYLAALLEPLADEVSTVDPGELRRLQKTMPKTDRRDAWGLAFWAAKGVLQPLWRPDADTMNLRELTRGKTALTRIATQLRNRMRSLLARHGCECPHRDLLGQKAQQWLTEVLDRIPGYAGQMLATLWQLLRSAQAAVDQFDQPLRQEAQRHPAARRLQSIPGIGPFLGLSLAAEIGDIRRFASPTKLRGYSGLTAKVDQSSNRLSYGPLTKRGNRHLRYAAVLAAQRMAQMKSADPRLKRAYLAVAFKHGRNPAKVDCARRLLDLAHHLLTHEEDYRAPRSIGAAVAPVKRRPRTRQAAAA